MTALWLAYMLFSMALVVVSFQCIRGDSYNKARTTLLVLLLTANSICVGLLAAEAV